MVTEEVSKELANFDSVVIFGIEVCYYSNIFVDISNENYVVDKLGIISYFRLMFVFFKQ